MLEKKPVFVRYIPYVSMPYVLFLCLLAGAPCDESSGGLSMPWWPVHACAAFVLFVIFYLIRSTRKMDPAGRFRYSRPAVFIRLLQIPGHLLCMYQLFVILVQAGIYYIVDLSSPSPDAGVDGIFFLFLLLVLFALAPFLAILQYSLLQIGVFCLLLMLCFITVSALAITGLIALKKQRELSALKTFLLSLLTFISPFDLIVLIWLRTVKVNK